MHIIQNIYPTFITSNCGHPLPPYAVTSFVDDPLSYYTDLLLRIKDAK